MSEYERLSIAQGAINLAIQAALALGSLGIVALALCGDQIKDWWYGPKLKLSVQLEPPFCQRLSSGTWFRVKIENTGKTAARGVEVWIVDLSRHVQGVFLSQDLVPVPLMWTHTGKTTADSVNPSFHRYADLGSLNQTPTQIYGNPTGYFRVALPFVTMDTYSNLEPGSYAGRFAVTASNVPVRYWCFRFEVPEPAMPTEAEALKGVNLRIVS
jgi:hypothetical protein